MNSCLLAKKKGRRKHCHRLHGFAQILFSVCICEICGLFQNLKTSFMAEFTQKSDTYQIIGVCMEVYNTLGYGFSEIVYKDAMEIEFIEKEMEHTWEEEHAVRYKGRVLQHKFFVDYTLFKSIIVEVKANKDGITEDAIAQALNYLKASGLKPALIINFGKTSLEYKRLVY
jgi:GxxExxY protein